MSLEYIPSEEHDLSHANIAEFAGIVGRHRLDVCDDQVVTLAITNGRVELQRDGGEPDAVARCADVDTLRAIARGTLNPVVAMLQERLELRGDLKFAVRVILALRGRASARG